MTPLPGGWKPVTFTAMFGEKYDQPCPHCGEYIDGCMCPVPTMETDDEVPYEYREIDGVLYARPPQPQNPITMSEETRELTLGEKRVRLTFNVSGDKTVNDIKRLSADLIDLCETLKEKDPRLASLAQTAYEEAAGWAVKAATA